MEAVGSALSGIESGIGSAVTGVENAASGLYHMLPSLSSLTGSTATPPPSTLGPGSTSLVTAPVDPTTGLPTPSAGAVAPNAPSAAAPASPTPSLLGAVAQALEMYQRYKMQRSLQNPNYVAGQIAKLEQPLSKNLVSGITKQVEGQAMERGLGGAPGLFHQALAEALAPYTFAEQNQAAQEYFDALGYADQEYPQGGGYGNFAQELAQGASALGF